MTHELGFEFAVIWGYDLVRLFMLWPRTKVVHRDYGANITFLEAFKGPQYKMFSPYDIMLLEDPAKREICVATILATKAHQAAARAPAPGSPRWHILHGIADWTKFLAGMLNYMYFSHGMAAFGDAWSALEWRWRGGDFSRMHP
jgi:hypothetical protein